MSEDWDGIAVQVKAALGAVGIAATFKSSSSTAGANPTTTFTDYSCNAYQSDWRIAERDGTRIRMDDTRFFLSATSGVPSPKKGDRLIFAGSTFNIVEVVPLSPAGVDLLYDVQARK